MKEAPWYLKGSGYILFFATKKAFEKDQNLWKREVSMQRILPLSVCMLVNYEDSPVGPYHEILFAPALYLFKKKYWRFSISKIYVSSPESVLGGIQNWAIPKELAKFTVQASQKGEQWHISTKEGEIMLNMEKGHLKFPINTNVIPLKLAQKKTNDLYLTTAKAKGKGSLAKCLNKDVSGTAFPPIHASKCLLALHVSDFSMSFEIPEIIPDF